MTRAKYREEWLKAEKQGEDFGTSFRLAVLPDIPVVFVMDTDDKPVGALKGSPEGINQVIKAINGSAFGSHTNEQVAALVEEMVSKGYDQMKARTLTVLESLVEHDKAQQMSNTPPGRLIGYALDDAKRVMLDVLAKRCPEVTPEMLTGATKARWEAERAASAEAEICSAEERVNWLKADLAEAERRLAQSKDRRVKAELVTVIKEAGPDVLKRVEEAVAGSIRRSPNMRA